MIKKISLYIVITVIVSLGIGYGIGYYNGASVKVSKASEQYRKDMKEINERLSNREKKSFF